MPETSANSQAPLNTQTQNIQIVFSPGKYQKHNWLFLAAGSSRLFSGLSDRICQTELLQTVAIV